MSAEETIGKFLAFPIDIIGFLTDGIA